MRKLVLAVLGLCFAIASGQALAFGGGTYFDLQKREWVTYGPGGYGGKSPVHRKRVRYNGPEKPGTIVIDTKERRLYHVMDNGRAMKYGIGVGRDGFQDRKSVV